MSKLKIAIVVFILLVIGGGAWFYFKSDKSDQTYITSRISRQNLIQTVSETGTVKAIKELNLSFGVSGKLKNIYVSKGDMVSEGQILVELDYQSLLHKKTEAEASLSIARNNLQKLLAGSSSEAIAVSKAGVDKAENSYNSALE